MQIKGQEREKYLRFAGEIGGKKGKAELSLLVENVI